MWPFRRRKDDDTQVAEAPAAAGGDAPAPAPSPSAWQTMAPVQRTFGEPSLTYRSATVGEIMPSWRNPSLSGELGHQVSADAPSGVIRGMATLVAEPPAPLRVQRQDLALREPAHAHEPEPDAVRLAPTAPTLRVLDAEPPSLSPPPAPTVAPDVRPPRPLAPVVQRRAEAPITVARDTAAVAPATAEDAIAPAPAEPVATSLVGSDQGGNEAPHVPTIRIGDVAAHEPPLPIRSAPLLDLAPPLQPRTVQRRSAGPDPAAPASEPPHPATASPDPHPSLRPVADHTAPLTSAEPARSGSGLDLPAAAAKTGGTGDGVVADDPPIGMPLAAPPHQAAPEASEVGEAPVQRQPEPDGGAAGRPSTTSLVGDRTPELQVADEAAEADDLPPSHDHAAASAAGLPLASAPPPAAPASAEVPVSRLGLGAPLVSGLHPPEPPPTGPPGGLPIPPVPRQAGASRQLPLAEPAPPPGAPSDPAPGDPHPMATGAPRSEHPAAPSASAPLQRATEAAGGPAAAPPTAVAGSASLASGLDPTIGELHPTLQRTEAAPASRPPALPPHLDLAEPAATAWSPMGDDAGQAKATTADAVPVPTTTTVPTIGLSAPLTSGIGNPEAPLRLQRSATPEAPLAGPTPSVTAPAATRGLPAMLQQLSSASIPGQAPTGITAPAPVQRSAPTMPLVQPAPTGEVAVTRAATALFESGVAHRGSDGSIEFGPAEPAPHVQREIGRVYTPPPTRQSPAPATGSAGPAPLHQETLAAPPAGGADGGDGGDAEEFDKLYERIRRRMLREVRHEIDRTGKAARRW